MHRQREVEKGKGGECVWIESEKDTDRETGTRADSKKERGEEEFRPVDAS